MDRLQLAVVCNHARLLGVPVRGGGNDGSLREPLHKMDLLPPRYRYRHTVTDWTTYLDNDAASLSFDPQLELEEGWAGVPIRNMASSAQFAGPGPGWMVPKISTPRI